MELHCASSRLQLLFLPVIVKPLKDSYSYCGSAVFMKRKKQSDGFDTMLSSPTMFMQKSFKSLSQGQGDRLWKCRSKTPEKVDVIEAEDGNEKGSEESAGSSKQNDFFDMDNDERKEWRRKIREVISMSPDVEEEMDPVEKRKKMQQLLAEYPLVVDEDDPDWPDDADGRGFNLDQFFNKITIKNVKKNDDENYDSENEIVWQDDDYIRPIKDITSADWEETVFKDISPLVVLVHNRYKRPKENEKIRDELEKAVHIIWNCRLPSPRQSMLLSKFNLVSALQVSAFPELIFTKAGKILYREKGIRTADDLSRIMAFFYFRAAKPPCLSGFKNIEEAIPPYTPNAGSTTTTLI